MAKQTKQEAKTTITPPMGANINGIRTMKATIDDPRLPNKSLFRPDEAADYFGYGIATIYTWIDHGILHAEKYRGTYRIPREAILDCRFKSKYDPLI